MHNVECILCNIAFFIAAVNKTSSFYVYNVLPEVLGKWYTNQPVLFTVEPSPSNTTEPESVAQYDLVSEQQYDYMDTS